VINISGVLIHAVPEKIQQVRQALASFPGVEIHGVNITGHMVVTLEGGNTSSMVDTLLQLQNVDDVLSALMVYHHCEEELVENDSGHSVSQELYFSTELNGQEVSR